MKDRPALARQVRLLATMAAPTSAGACLVLGTLAVSVRPGEDGQAEAMEWWGKASKIGDYNQAAFTACRNKYRARVLQQTGSHADKKDKVEAYLSLGIKRHNHPGQSSYERALVLLDEHPAFPRIGVVNKREGRMYLKDAAEKNHEAAKARLARL